MQLDMYESALRRNGRHDICSATNYNGNPVPYLTDWVVNTCSRKSPTEAFGIASGYAVYIELLATVVFISMLTVCGILTTTKAFKQALREALEEVKVRPLEEKFESASSTRQAW